MEDGTAGLATCGPQQLLKVPHPLRVMLASSPRSLEIHMNNQFRKSSLLLLIVAMAFATAACNTTKGLGKDVEKVGEEIQEEAEQHD